MQKWEYFRHVMVLENEKWWISYFFGFSKLDVMFGRKTPDSVRLAYSNIVKPGVRFRQETITAIDPDKDPA